jgi:Holliday junction resolvase RusA-like endonuclease
MDHRTPASLPRPLRGAAPQAGKTPLLRDLGTQARPGIGGETERSGEGGLSPAVEWFEERSTVIAFEIPGPPVGKGRPRAFRMGNNVRMHTPEKTASYESMVKLAAHRAMKGAALLSFPVALSLVVLCPIPKSWSKRRQEAALAGTERPTTKPDADNVAKAIADACNGVVWVDDAQVVELSVSKRYSATPGVMVEVRPA